MNRFGVVVLIGLAAALPGCASGGADASNGASVMPEDPTPAEFPQPFEVTFYSSSKQGRHVYYVIDPEGMLHFGGGRNAHIRAADAVGRLTNAHRNRIWQFIQKHKLMAADGDLFASHERVRYAVEIEAGEAENRFSTVDDRVAGLQELDALLFGLQNEMRSSRVYQAVEEQIRRSGGAVPKQ